MKLSRAMLFLMVLAGWAGPVMAEDTPTGGYKVQHKVSLAGDGGWDLLTADSDARRVYLTHNNSVQVVDADSLKLLGTLEGVNRPHGVAVVPELNRGFVTSGDPGSIIVFDLKTFQKVQEIPGQKDADAITYDPATKRLFSFNGDSQDATVIDAATGKVVKTLDLGGAPELGAADGKGTVYDNLSSKSLVLKIDAKTLKITQRWPLAPGESPTGMAMDRENNLLFVGCRNKLMVVMDADSGKVLKTFPIGEHVDSTAFDPGTGMVFNSCGDGTLSVIHEDSPGQFTPVENAKTEPGARTMALDLKTGRVFLPAAKNGPPPKPTQEHPKPWGKIIPGTFHLLVVGK